MVTVSFGPRCTVTGIVALVAVAIVTPCVEILVTPDPPMM
jgi:hypothetical protein